MPVSEQGRERQREALARGRARGGGRKFAVGDGRPRGRPKGCPAPVYEHKPSCLYIICSPASRGPACKAALTLEQIFASKRRISGGTIKAKLLAAGLKKDECEVCGLPPIWNGKPLVIQLDHVDGDETNNTLGNLRLACPNCHTQTPTWGRKNRLPK